MKLYILRFCPAGGWKRLLVLKQQNTTDVSTATNVQYCLPSSPVRSNTTDDSCEKCAMMYFNTSPWEPSKKLHLPHPLQSKNGHILVDRLYRSDCSICYKYDHILWLEVSELQENYTFLHRMFHQHIKMLYFLKPHLLNEYGNLVVEVMNLFEKAKLKGQKLNITSLLSKPEFRQQYLALY